MSSLRREDHGTLAARALCTLEDDLRVARLTEHYSHVSLEEKKQATAKVLQLVGDKARSKKGGKRGVQAGKKEKRSAAGQAG